MSENKEKKWHRKVLQEEQPGSDFSELHFERHKILSRLSSLRKVMKDNISGVLVHVEDIQVTHKDITEILYAWELI